MDPKTQTPYIVLDDLNEINALPDGPEKERRLAANFPDSSDADSRSRISFSAATTSATA